MPGPLHNVCQSVYCPPASRVLQSLSVRTCAQPLEGVPVRERCDPASVGEYWFREHVVHTLKECGPACANIRLLPIYDLSLSRHNSHHGTYGRGKETGYTDCRHYCVNVIDWWNVVLYAMVCF